MRKQLGSNWNQVRMLTQETLDNNAKNFYDLVIKFERINERTNGFNLEYNKRIEGTREKLSVT
jgi:hypothetical protein